jgi:hypothetical protein
VLGQTVAVVRRGVEIADAALERVPKEHERGLVRHRRVEIAERRAAEAESC